MRVVFGIGFILASLILASRKNSSAFRKAWSGKKARRFLSFGQIPQNDLNISAKHQAFGENSHKLSLHLRHKKLRLCMLRPRKLGLFRFPLQLVARKKRQASVRNAKYLKDDWKICKIPGTLIHYMTVCYCMLILFCFEDKLRSTKSNRLG